MIIILRGLLKPVKILISAAVEILKFSINNPIKIIGLSLMIDKVQGSSSSSAMEFVSCGENLEPFAPQAALSYVQIALADDCIGQKFVPSLFNHLNAKAYAADYCSTYKKAQGCHEIIRELNDINKLKMIDLSISPKTFQMVPEGHVLVSSSDQTLVTVDISFCVGVAIKGSSTDQVLLAHINAENIKAYDAYLKSNQLSPGNNPFHLLSKYVENHSNLEATLASGSAANLFYIKTLLSHLGVNNITLFHNQKWAKGDKSGVNQGNLLIQNKIVSLVKNPQDFKKFVSPFPMELKNQAVSLKQGPSNLLTFSDSLYKASSKISENNSEKRHKKEYRKRKQERQRDLRRRA